MKFKFTTSCIKLQRHTGTYAEGHIVLGIVSSTHLINRYPIVKTDC
jgi:hypothetical protein